MVTRLQLGTSRLELLPAAALKVFANKTWTHFGDKPPGILRDTYRYIRASLNGINVDKIYAATHFEPFHFKVGDKLPFRDGALNYIFSEHFFEHLYPAETEELMRECHRVLAPGGLMRVSVPDAVLRTYEPHEPEGFPVDLPADHPQKHKVRWTVYSLSDALRAAGFEPRPLRYCDRDGNYVRGEGKQYADCVESELAADLSYLRRPDSLIVDGIRR